MLKMPRDTKRLLSVPAALAMFGIAILTGSCGGGNADAEDPCHDILCSGHGTCALVQDEPICACDPGYHPDGLSCLPDDVDPCQGIDCSDHGSCVVQGDEPTCVCETGYHPEDLQCVANSSEQPCEGVDCSGHGTCIVQDGYPDCQCDEGYVPAGLACVEESDPCDGVTCSNHGACVLDADGNAACNCDEGYHPEELDCIENDVDNPCEGVTCSGHGNCEPGDDNEPVCHCETGYHAEGLTCVQDEADPCEGVTCSGHGQCLAEGGQARCECDAGYHPTGLACIADDIAGDRPVWFLHITDCHYGESAVTSTLTSTFVDEIVPVIQPTATINTGDTADNGRATQWSWYVNDTANAPEYPYFFEIPGNHDKKTGDGQPFIDYSRTGQAGGGFYGVTLVPSTAGTVRVVRADTADSSVNAMNIAGIFGSEQATALGAMVDESNNSVALTIFAAHHPMVGLEKLRLGATSLQGIIDRSGAQVYLCGHTHRAAIDWLGAVLHVTGPSVGKTDPTSYSLVAIDSTGPSVRLINLTAPPEWPVVMITTPEDASLGGENPLASPLPAGGTTRVRAIAFAASGVEKVELQVAGSGNWQEMEAVGNNVYQQDAVLPATGGETSITVRATSLAGGSDTHEITVEVN